MAFDQIVSPNPTPEAPDETALQTALSEKPSAWEQIKSNIQESFVARHLTPGQTITQQGPNDVLGRDIVQEFKESPESESHRTAQEFHRQQLEAIPSQAQLARRPGEPEPPKQKLYEPPSPDPEKMAKLLSPEQVQDRYGFLGLDGKPVTLTKEAVPDDVAQELLARKIEQTRRQSVMARWQNAHHYETPLGQVPTPYGFAVDLISPDTVAMSLIPPIGEEALIAKLGSGLVGKTAAKSISGSAMFATGSATMMALDKVIPDWRGNTSDLTLRQALDELYGSAATGAILHAAINPAIGYAWRQGTRIALERAGRGSTGSEPPGAPPAPPEKDIGSLTDEISKLESADGLTRRKAMDTATGQVLDGKPVEVRPHFDPETSDGVIQEQQRQDREGYAQGMHPEELAEETARIYLPEEPEPDKFDKDMGGPIMSPAQMWAAKAVERAGLVREVALLQEASRRWIEGGAESQFPEGPELAQKMSRLRDLDREVEELRNRTALVGALSRTPGALSKASRTPEFNDIVPLIPRDAKGDTDFEGFQRFLAEMFGKTNWRQLNGEERRALPGLLMREGMRRPYMPPLLEAPKVAENIPAPPAPGMIRYYHGTASDNAKGFTGKTFVSPHFEYARDYRGGSNNVLYTDFTREEAIKRGLFDETNGIPINGAIENGAALLKPHTIIPRPIVEPKTAIPGHEQGEAEFDKFFGDAFRDQLRKFYEARKALEEVGRDNFDHPRWSELREAMAEAEESLVETARIMGLPGDTMEHVTPINSYADIEKAFLRVAKGGEKAPEEQKVLAGPEPTSGEVIRPGELPPGPVTDAILDRDAKAAELDEWLKHQDEYPEEEAQRLYRGKMADIDNAFEDALIRHQAGVGSVAEALAKPQEDRGAEHSHDIGGGLEAIDARDIGVDAKKMQFKAGADEAGVSERLKGVEAWNPMLAGTVIVWRDASGKTWIADGHQRLALANRLMEAGHPPIKINAFVLKEGEGVSAKGARVLAASKNIAEGTGTAIDAAKVIREAEGAGLDLPQMPPRSALVRDGKALSRLSPKAFGAVVNDVIPPEYGAIVGRLVTGDLEQQEAIRLLNKAKPDTVRQAELIVKDMQAFGMENFSKSSLFGDEMFAESMVLERAKVLEDAMRQIKSDKKTFATLVNESDRIIGHGGNVLDAEANKSKLTEDQRVQKLIETLATRVGPISAALTEIAKRFKSGDISRAEAGRAFLRNVRKRSPEILEAGHDSGGAVSGSPKPGEGKPEGGAPADIGALSDKTGRAYLPEEPESGEGGEGGSLFSPSGSRGTLGERNDGRTQELGNGRTATQIESGVAGARPERVAAAGEGRAQPEGAYQARKALPGDHPIPFEIPGYKGRIFRDSPGENGLAGTYRFQVFSHGGSSDPIATMVISERQPNRWEVEWVMKHGRERGIATKLYDAVEDHLAAPITPSGLLTQEGLAFWKQRNPELVRFHRLVEDEEGEGFNYSPRMVKKYLDLLENKSVHDVEREQLQKIWNELPDEVKTPEHMELMFAPSGSRGTLGDPRNPMLDLIRWRDREAAGLEKWLAQQDHMEPKEAQDYYRRMLAQIDHTFHEEALKYQQAGSVARYRALKRQERAEQVAKTRGERDLSFMPSGASWRDIIGRLHDQEFSLSDWLKALPDEALRAPETGFKVGEYVHPLSEDGSRVLPNATKITQVVNDPQNGTWVQMEGQGGFWPAKQLERAEGPAKEAEAQAVPETQGARPAYMASPEEIAKHTRTPEEMEAAKQAQQRGMEPVSFSDMPPEEKPLDLMSVRQVDNRSDSEPQPSDLDYIRAKFNERRAGDLDYIRDKLNRTGLYRISEVHRQETLRIADETVRKLAPPGVKVFVIEEIKLDEDGTPWVFYKTSNGEKVFMPESLSGPTSAFGFFEPASKSIFLNRVTALGESDHLLGGIVEHEVTHFARKYGVFLPGGALHNSWRRILAHADKSSVLDLSIGDYADLIGDPLPGSHTVRYRNVFDKLYKDGPGKQEKLDGESVALSIQLYSAMKARNDPAIAAFDPVKRDIEAYLSGEYKNLSPSHVPDFGDNDLLYSRAAGLEGNPRGTADKFLREPSWPLSADVIEASKAAYLRSEIGKINKLDDYDFAIRSLQDNMSLSGAERDYLDRLRLYTSGRVPGSPNVVMVNSYYRLTGRKLNEPVSIGAFHEAYLEDAQKLVGTDAANRKEGRPFYVKTDEQFRSHLERFGRESDADLGGKIPSQPKAWLVNKEDDTVSLTPYVPSASSSHMFMPAGGEGGFKPAPDQMEDFANQATRYFLSRGAAEITPLLKSYQQELDAFGRKTTAQDAIAFFKSYFTQPSAARSLAPGFTRAVDELFNRIDPDTHARFQARASEYEAGMQRTAGEPSDTSGLSAETAAELAKYEGILNTFDARALLPEELGELKQTADDLASAKTADEKEAAARRRSDAIVNAIARKDVMDEVRENGGISNAKWSLRSILHGTNSGSRLSIEAVWNGLRAGWLGILDNEVRKAGLRKMAVSGSMDREVSREIWKMNLAQSMETTPETEGTPSRRLAEILWPLMRNAKDRMNQAGARIGDALDYVLSTYHDPYKLRAAAGSMRDELDQAFQAWWKFVLPRINHAKTFADLVPEEGQGIEQAREAFGRSVFNALVTGVHLTFRGGEAHPQESGGTALPAFEGSFNLGRRVSQQRVLFWKDADSWFDYHQRFGPANSLTHAVINSLERSARNVALMERIGTNPKGNLNLIIRKIEEEYRNTDPDAVARFRRRDVSGLQDVMAHLDGSVNMPANDMWAALNSSYRTWFSASALGGVGLTHFASIWPTVPSELTHHGISRVQGLQMMVGKLVSSIGGRGSEERQALDAELGAFADGTIRALHRKWLPTGQDTVPGRISAIAARLLEYSGIHHIFDTVQAGVRETLAQNLARNFSKDLVDLEPHLRQMIGKYGIGEDEWNLFRRVPATEADGRRYLTPRDARSVDRLGVEAMLRERGKLADDAAPETIKAAVDSEIDGLSDRLLAYYTDAAKHSTIGGSIREKAAAIGQARPGTFSGEMLRHLMLYKMWPLAQIYQGLGREYYMSFSNWERAWKIGVLGGLSMLGGFMRMAIADAVSGNPQRDVFDPKNMATALMQGGGVGLFGDYLFGEIGRNGAHPLESLAGPAASDVGALMHMIYRWRDEALDEHGHKTGTGFGDLAHFGVRHIPFGNLIYLRGASNYMLWQHLYEAVDPGYWNRMNRRMLKERGHGMVGFSPGSGPPFGIPGLYLQHSSGRAEGLLAGH